MLNRTIFLDEAYLNERTREKRMLVKGFYFTLLLVVVLVITFFAVMALLEGMVAIGLLAALASVFVIKRRGAFTSRKRVTQLLQGFSLAKALGITGDYLEVELQNVKYDKQRGLKALRSYPVRLIATPSLLVFYGGYELAVKSVHPTLSVSIGEIKGLYKDEIQNSPFSNIRLLVNGEFDFSPFLQNRYPGLINPPTSEGQIEQGDIIISVVLLKDEANELYNVIKNNAKNK